MLAGASLLWARGRGSPELLAGGSITVAHHQ